MHVANVKMFYWTGYVYILRFLIKDMINMSIMGFVIFYRYVWAIYITMVIRNRFLFFRVNIEYKGLEGGLKIPRSALPFSCKWCIFKLVFNLVLIVKYMDAIQTKSAVLGNQTKTSAWQRITYTTDLTIKKICIYPSD